MLFIAGTRMHDGYNVSDEPTLCSSKLQVQLCALLQCWICWARQVSVSWYVIGHVFRHLCRYGETIPLSWRSLCTALCVSRHSKPISRCPCILSSSAAKLQQMKAYRCGWYHYSFLGTSYVKVIWKAAALCIKRSTCEHWYHCKHHVLQILLL